MKLVDYDDEGNLKDIPTSGYWSVNPHGHDWKVFNYKFRFIKMTV